VIAVHSDAAILAEAGRVGQGRAVRSGPDRALAREDSRIVAFSSRGAWGSGSGSIRFGAGSDRDAKERP